MTSSCVTDHVSPLSPRYVRSLRRRFPLRLGLLGPLGLRLLRPHRRRRRLLRRRRVARVVRPLPRRLLLAALRLRLRRARGPALVDAGAVLAVALDLLDLLPLQIRNQFSPQKSAPSLLLGITVVQSVLPSPVGRRAVASCSSLTSATKSPHPGARRDAGHAARLEGDAQPRREQGREQLRVSVRGERTSGGAGSVVSIYACDSS